MISCGKDNRSIVWNTSTSQAIGDLHHSSNWQYDVQWNAQNPDQVAIASFDGKVTVHSLLGAKSNLQIPTSPSLSKPKLFDDPFQISPFSSSSSELIETGFKLSNPPRWLKRPCGVSWSFDNKLIEFNSTCKNIIIKTASVESGFDSRVDALEQVLKSPLNVQKDFCALMSRELNGNDKKTWEIITSLFDNDKKSIIEFLGFDLNTPAGELSSLFEKLVVDSGKLVHPEPKKEFQLYPKIPLKTESQYDTIITRSIILGDFESAVTVCLATNRLSDALLIASNGSPELLLKTQSEYYNRTRDGKTYIRLLEGISLNSLERLVENCVLDSKEETWKDLVALLCSHSTERFCELVSIIANRLHSKIVGSDGYFACVLCFLLAGDIPKVVELWITDINADYSTRLLLIQGLVEKISLFKSAFSYIDSELDNPSEFKLAKLYDLYHKYAIECLSQGHVEFAWEMLKLVPKSWSGDGLNVLRDRVYRNLNLTVDAPEYPFSSEFDFISNQYGKTAQPVSSQSGQGYQNSWNRTPSQPALNNYNGIFC